MPNNTDERTVAIRLPTALVEQVEQELVARGSSLHDYIRMQLIAFKRTKVLIALDDIMPNGKYAGELVEQVVRADPGYVKWLCEQEYNKDKFRQEVYNMALDMLLTKPKKDKS